MKLTVWVSILTTTFWCQTSECARILGIFPTPSISHQVVFHALVKDLAARGHELTILTTDLIKINNSNVTQIDLHETYEMFHREMKFMEHVESKTDEYDFMKAVMPVFMKIAEDQLAHPEVKKIIENADQRSYDLVILEYLYYAPMLAFAEVYDCPVIGITSLENITPHHVDFGNEANPTIHPEIGFAYLHGKLAFHERWESIKYHLKSKYFLVPMYEEGSKKTIERFFPKVKSSINQLKERMQILMENTNPALGFIRPLLPNTIQLGFMHIEPPKPLPSGELKTFLDNSKNGVVYMSLGSNVQSKDLSPEKLQILLKVFGSLNCNVLWKFEADDLPNKPDNVMISKWTPQSDLLAHPAIKLFITQGGQQSMEEAIDRAIPMIVIPFVGDQFMNSNRMEEKKIGKHLDLLAMTEENLKTTINEMLKPKYKQNIIKLRELVYDQPMTSRERAVWWTEYVIRHKGAKHLEYPGRLVPFYQKYCLDFAAHGLIMLFVVFKALSVVTKFLFSLTKVKTD